MDIWSGRGVGVWPGGGGSQTPPHPEMATAAVGTHPTGVHSCWCLCLAV